MTSVEPQSAPAAARTFTDRLTALANQPVGAVILVVLALLEATVFPGPTEAMLVALTLGRRERVVWFAGLAIVASVIGGIGGYFLGAVVFNDIVRPLLDSYGIARHMDAVARVYTSNMLLALTTSGYTPIPYMLYTSMAGAAHLPLGTFIAGSLIGRALKYVPMALIAYFLGPRAQRFLRRFGIVGLVVVIAIIITWTLL
ncbi:MAG: VTT domain-containing protein [Gemmatimonadaceae bacterium]